jgi:hypothetical protein
MRESGWTKWNHSQKRLHFESEGTSLCPHGRPAWGSRPRTKDPLAVTCVSCRRILEARGILQVVRGTG